MPNYCGNRMKMKGLTKLDLFQDGEETLDFMKIVPMPEALDVDEGSMRTEAMGVYLTERMRKDPKGLDETEKNLLEGREWDPIDGKTKEERERLFELGKQYVDNLRKYGFSTWYGWRSERWGTKWNAWDGRFEGDDVVTFITAWSPPEPVVETLSELYPENTIEVEWEEEGGCAGKFAYKNGERLYDETAELGDFDLL